MEDKGEGLANKNIMRVEFRLKKEAAIKSCLGDDRLDYLKDENIVLGFNKKIKAIYKKIDKYLPEGQSLKCRRSSDRSGANIAADLLDKSIIIDECENRFDYKGFIGRILAFEQAQGRLPCILDIADCKNLFRNFLNETHLSQEVEHTVKTFYDKLLQKYYEIDPDLNLCRQRERFNEIVKKTTENQTFSVFLNC